MRKTVVCILSVMALMIGVVTSAYGFGTYLTDPTTGFNAKYPSATALSACKLCHIDPNGGGPRNPFGVAFAGAGHSFAAIESLDSDGDGFSNLAEINAGTWPGDATSHPAPTPSLSLSLNPTTLPAGTQGTAYSQNVTMSATGGTSPYTFTCSGSGVAGLTASASAAVCTIGGTPAATGTFTVNFSVTDAAAATASSTLSFNVSSSSTPPPPPPPPSSGMPLPTGRQVFSYYPVDVPVVSSDPKTAKPIGVGPIANNGDTVDIAVNVGPFEAPVDVSLGVYAIGVDSADIYLLDMGFNLKPLSKAITEANKGEGSSEGEGEDPTEEHEGLVKWKTNVLSVNEHVFGPTATKDLAPGPYVLVLGVKPSDAPRKGHRSYLWVTYFIVP